MSYQLDFAQTINASFIGNSFWDAFGLYFGLILVPIFTFFIPQIPSIYRKTLFVFAIIAFAIKIVLYGSGWQITDNNLHIKTYWSSADVKISTMEIGFIEDTSKWWHSGKFIGGDFPELVVGEYSLKNGKVALVFNHHNQKELLLISSQGKYYLIGHPGVIALYNDLIRLGARERNFDK